MLAAVAPASLEASLAAVAGVEEERAALTRQWHLKRERVAFEVDRAARQSHACEPENRLVGHALEQLWEQTLGRQRQLEEEFERSQRSAPARLSESAASVIRALARDLPRVWSAPTTTAADRQRIARFLLERVVITVDKASERVEVVLHWFGGCFQSRTLVRPVTRYSTQSDFSRMVERLRELCRTRETSRAIAERLNADGFQPPKRTSKFTASMIARLTSHLGFSRRQRPGSMSDLAADEYRPIGLARHLALSRDTIRRWMRAGWLNARREAEGHHILWADAEELKRLRELSALPRTRANKPRLAVLKQPKRRPML